MDNFFTKLGNESKSNNKLNKQLYQHWFNTGMPVSPSRNYTADLIEGYLDNAVVYSIVNKIARPASQVPIEIVNSDNEVMEDHWANILIKRPNEDTTFSELIFNYYVYLLSIGNSFIYAPRLSDGRTLELWTAPGEMTEIVAGNWRSPVKGYEIIYGESRDPIAKKDMMHGKLFYPRFNTAGTWNYGLSPIQVASEIIRNINAGDDRMALMAEQGGPPFIISSQTPEGLTEQQQEMLESTYERKYMGMNNINLPMMTGTPIKVEQVGTNASDLDLVKSSEYATRVLCNIYGIDSVLLNDKSASTFNNLKELRKDLYNSTIIPLNNILEDKLSNWLLLNEDAKFRFNYDNVEVLSSTIDDRMIALNDVAFLSDNEKRVMFGYDEVEEELKQETTEVVEPLKENENE